MAVIRSIELNCAVVSASIQWLATKICGKTRVHIGQKLGSYKVISLLGKGGMGEVYRARDTKLKRDVAIKVLPEEFAEDSDRLTRFRREAYALASLNHQSIAAIYGLEESDGELALVLELAEGLTLGDRLLQGAIPCDEALAYAKQIAEALETAHAKGILHRDLKPANVKITEDGKVKVLDFGLAKMFEAEPASPLVSNSPTMMSQTGGAIMGTASYMSPEQARGKQVDHRTDVWAFGCVLFEMLAGRVTFAGDNVTDILANIVKTEPDWKLLPADTPQLIFDLLKRCLRKDMHRRLQNIGDARAPIEDLVTGLEPLTVQTLPGNKTGGWKTAAMIAIAFLVGSSFSALWFFRSPAHSSDASSIQFSTEVAGKSLQLSETSTATMGAPAVAISPDGKRIVFATSERLYIRNLEELDPRPIVGTERGHSPFFSPDGQWIAFKADKKLKKVPIQGGSPVALCNLTDGSFLGGSWGIDDSIIFAQSQLGLSRVSSAGGNPVTMAGHQEGNYDGWPIVLPDGKTVIFTRSRGTGEGEIFAQVVNSAQQRRLTAGSNAEFVQPDKLLFVQAGNLMVAPFDVRRLEVKGPPKLAISDVWQNSYGGYAHFATSPTGAIVFVPRSSRDPQRKLVWVDRQGRITETRAQPGVYRFPRISPDGQRVATTGNGDVWVYDTRRESLNRITVEGTNSRSLWTPDGKRITFVSNSKGIYSTLADGSGGTEKLVTSDYSLAPEAWSPDGRTLAFSELRPDTGWDIWTFSLPDKKSALFLRTPFHDGARAFSSDGRWLAYYSDESGRGEVYIRQFPGGVDKIQISTEGGAEPVFARNGRELFYRSGRHLMVVDIALQPTFTASKPRSLFEGLFETALPANFDVSPDGQRFIMVLPDPEEGNATRVNVVLNRF
jgi:serine/threonine-protein kinase